MTVPNEWAALVAAVADARDKEAFARLFDHFAPRLQAYLGRLGSEPGQAEEIAQDVMKTLWHKAALFDPAKSSVSTWLYRVARNRRIDGLRRNRLDFVDAREAFDAIPDEPETDRLLDLHQREEALRGALGALPEEQLALVRLAFFEGLSHRDIAERAGLPLGTVKSRLRLAFTRLRRVLESKGIVEAG